MSIVTPITGLPDDVVWPEGADRSVRSLSVASSPTDFIVAMLPDRSSARSVEIALQEAGIASTAMRVYSSEQILEDDLRHPETRSLARRFIGALSDDDADIELYFSYAREGRCALWVHVPGTRDADRALRCFAIKQVLRFGPFVETVVAHPEKVSDTALE